MKITLKIPALALLAALTVSCSLDQVREVNPGEAISFRSFSGGYTRAQSVDEITVGDIYVYAFKDGSLYFSDVFTNNSVDASGYWESDAPYYWPATQTGGTAPSLTFLAFNGDAMGADGTFMSAASFSMDAPPSGTSGVNVTDLTVPASIDDQIDLVVARAGNRTEANSANGVSLNFRHALTAVKFVVGDLDECTVKSIAVKGVRNKGTYQFKSTQRSSENHDMADWTVDAAGTGDFVLSNLGFQNTASNAGAQITDDTQYLMMMPQTVPAGAVIEVVFDQNGTEHTLSASIAGHVWRRGETVTYRISADLIEQEFFIDATPSKTSIPYSGGEAYFNVKSYIKETAGTKVTYIPKPWKAQIVVLDNNAAEADVLYSDGTDKYRLAKQSDFPVKPQTAHQGDFYFKNASGINASKVGFEISGSGTNSETATTLGAHFYLAKRADSTKSAVGKSPRDRNLQGKGEVGTRDAPKNLAETESANCYVVNAPGWYKFPMVYGNSYKGGSANSGAYKIASGNTNNLDQKLQRFPNHNHVVLTGPWIADNLQYNTLGVKLLWQDVEGMVTQVEKFKENGKDYIRFYIGQDKIRQGNAVISVHTMNSSTYGEIAWSWHIWVTDYEIADVFALDQTYSFMKMPLGYVEDDVFEFAGGKMYVLFTQEDGTAQKLVRIDQEAGHYAQSGNALYYQWGRKDPYRASLTGSTGEKPVYPSNIFTWSTNHATLGEAISNPTTAYTCVSTHDGEQDRTYIADAWWKHPRQSLVYRWGGDTKVDPSDANYPPKVNGVIDQDWFKNLWDVNLSNGTINWTGATTTTKSIYDPCPPGFCVPPYNAFKGFSGKKVSRTDLDASGRLSGMYIEMTDKNFDRYEFFFPALGHRISSGTSGFPPADIRVNVWYWTSSFSHLQHAHGLYVSVNKTNFVTDLYTAGASYGMNILPVTYSSN